MTGVSAPCVGCSRRIARGLVTIAHSRFSFGACLLLYLVADFFLARGLYPNSDSVQSYNEMLAVRGGNLFLGHWVLATDNFLLTDLPLFILSSFILGTGPRLIFIVPFLIFFLLLVACLGIARSVALTPSERIVGGYLVLFLLGTSYGLHYDFFFWSDFHVATITVSLYAVLVAGPALSGRPFNRGRLAPFTALIFAAAFSDPLVDGLLVGPLMVLATLRAWLMRRCYVDDWLLVGCSLFAVVGAVLALRAAPLVSGFVTLPSVGSSFVPGLPAVSHDIHALFSGGQILFTGRSALIGKVPLHQLIAISRQITAAAAAFLCLFVMWRMPKAPHNGVAQWLVIGAVSLAALEVISASFASSIASGIDFPHAAIRFVVPLFVFGCLAAAIEGQSLLSSRHPLAQRFVAFVGMCFLTIYTVGGVSVTLNAAQNAPGIRAAPQAVLAQWLQRRHLHYGLGDYWDTQLVQALSGGHVIADPVTNVQGRLKLFTWLTDTSRFGPQHRPQFVIIRPYGLFHVDLPAVIATYGQPLSITEVADFYFVARLADGK